MTNQLIFNHNKLVISSVLLHVLVIIHLQIKNLTTSLTNPS